MELLLYLLTYYSLSVVRDKNNSHINRQAVFTCIMAPRLNFPGENEENKENSFQGGRSSDQDENPNLPNTKQECQPLSVDIRATLLWIFVMMYRWRQASISNYVPYFFQSSKMFDITQIKTCVKSDDPRIMYSTLRQGYNYNRLFYIT